MTPAHAPRRGFTLIELLVVMAIVAVLAAIGIPRFQAAVLQGHLEDAKPYLMAIAAKERARFHERGYYLRTTEERDIKRDLGVDLKDAGDFCFMVMCTALATTRCQSCEDGGCTDWSDTSNPYIAASETGDPAVEFEVWAVLRNSGDPATWKSQTCRIQRTTDGTGGTVEKRAATGWVRSAASVAAASAGGQGRVVVLRYPAPPDGIDATASTVDQFNHDWLSGISVSDAMQE